MDHSTTPIDPTDESNDSKRTRSPAYPAIGLREAVEIAKSILELAGHQFNEVSSDAISERLGLKENGSVFRVKMSALKKFDLVDEIQPDQWRLTSGALIIFDETTSELDRAKTLSRIALHPTIYEDLYGKFKNKPSRLSVKVYLHRQKFNPKVFETLINDFVDSMLFAGLFSADFASKFQSKQIPPISANDDLSAHIEKISEEVAEILRVDRNDPSIKKIVDRFAENSLAFPARSELDTITKNSESIDKSIAEALAKIRSSSMSVNEGVSSQLAEVCRKISESMQFNTAHLAVADLLKRCDESTLKLPDLSSMTKTSEELSKTMAEIAAKFSTTPNLGNLFSESLSPKPAALPAPQTAAPARIPSPAQTSVTLDTLQIPVGEGRHAAIPYPMDEASYDILMETLRLWKPKIVNTKPDEKKNA